MILGKKTEDIYLQIFLDISKTIHKLANKKNNMKPLIIDRSKWRTGGNKLNEQYGDTKLLNDKGFMCCLGFYCLQIGNKKTQDIEDIALPENLDNYDGIEALINNKTYYNSDFTETAIRINDSTETDNDLREHKIIEHFKEINVSVNFVGEYV